MSASEWEGERDAGEEAGGGAGDLGTEGREVGGRVMTGGDVSGGGAAGGTGVGDPGSLGVTVEAAKSAGPMSNGVGGRTGRNPLSGGPCLFAVV